MPYDESLASRLRKRLSKEPEVEEKAMMGGLVFMIDDKMCLCVLEDSMMVRVDPADVPELLRRPGASPMAFTGRTMKSFVVVSPEGHEDRSDFETWVTLALEYNRVAKRSKRKSAKPTGAANGKTRSRTEEV